MRLESKADAMLALYIVATAVGLLLMWLARDFSHAGPNVQAGFMLGCLLAGLGLLALLVGESRTVELDRQRRRIVLDVRRRVGGNRRIEIPFADIRSLGIGLQGKASSGSRFYDLIVKLKSGREICLFGGCVFEGRMSRQWIEDLKARSEQIIFAEQARPGKEG